MEPVRHVRAQTNDGWHDLNKNGGQWSYEDVVVDIADGLTPSVVVTAATTPLCRLQISWEHEFAPATRFLGDAFERGYGDLGFYPMRSDTVFHWYFCATGGERKSSCWGVATRPNALCSWTLTSDAVDLWLDIRNGSHPLELKGRQLVACTLVIADYDRSSFEALSEHCELMAGASHAERRAPIAEPIVGANDWYYAYGHNSARLVERSAQFMRSIWPEDSSLDPWVVIDDGWEVQHSDSYNGAPWDEANARFGDMAQVAHDLKEAGVHPGLWFRPLLSCTRVASDTVLHENDDGTLVLDASHPAVLQEVSETVSRFVSWGYELIKHDFTTYDVFGQWGFQMGAGYESRTIDFYDKEHTTAEIMNRFYDTIRQAAGQDSVLLGCNTISHLSAGVFDVMRVGDDTSGMDFNRTRRMGVNSLAFRMPQNRRFYLCDADCIGITDKIDWSENRKWLQLLSQSGTPLFISCSPDELDAGQVEDLRVGVKNALDTHRDAVPSSWEGQTYPSVWDAQAGEQIINWYKVPREFPAQW